MNGHGWISIATDMSDLTTFVLGGILFSTEKKCKKYIKMVKKDDKRCGEENLWSYSKPTRIMIQGGFEVNNDGN